MKTFLILNLPGIRRHFQLHPWKKQAIFRPLYQGEGPKSCTTGDIEVSRYIPPVGCYDLTRGIYKIPPGGFGLCLPLPRGGLYRRRRTKKVSVSYSHRWDVMIPPVGFYMPPVGCRWEKNRRCKRTFLCVIHHRRRMNLTRKTEEEEEEDT